MRHAAVNADAFHHDDDCVYDGNLVCATQLTAAIICLPDEVQLSRLHDVSDWTFVFVLE